MALRVGRFAALTGIAAVHLATVRPALAGDLTATSSLRSEAMMHPLDSFSADVLHKGELFYGQPPLPVPGWALWGVTDNLTVQLDFTVWLGGVPDVNLRWRLLDRRRGGWGLAVETMGLYLREGIGDLNDSNDHLFIERRGLSGYARLIATRSLTDRAAVSVSAGASYSEWYRVANENRSIDRGLTVQDYVEPVAAVALDVRLADWLSVHGTASYGETFLYSENRPRKWQATYGMRIAPFVGHRLGVLRNLRIELAAFYTYFPDARESIRLLVPIYPYLYWQWGGGA